MDKSCPICLGIFHRESHQRSYKARTCRHKLASPGPDCWFERGGIHTFIAESLQQPRPRVKESADLRERLLRDLQKASGVSEQVARQHLERLTPHERWSLLQFSAPDLRDWLLKNYKLDDLEVSPNLESVCYPELPENLLAMLTAWETKNRNRLIARMNSGHSRSPTTLRRMMVEPIALARFLSENGITRWDAMKMSDRVAFAKTRPKRVQQKLKGISKNPC